MNNKQSQNNKTSEKLRFETIVPGGWNWSHIIKKGSSVQLTDPEGGSNFEDGISQPMKYVEMTAKMNTLMLVSNCPQLNNPCNAYNPTPVEMTIWNPA